MLPGIKFNPHDHALLGYIPSFASEADPTPLKEQLDRAYSHGGGWSPFNGFKIVSHTDVAGKSLPCIQYPGDPPYTPLSWAQFRDQTIIIYPHAWVMILEPDGKTFEISRMD